MEAKKITALLPPFVQCVGLFVNEDAKSIDTVCKDSGMDIAQIHFEADEDLYNSLEIKHIKVIRAQSRADLDKYKDEYRIVDAFVENYGGDGKRVALEWFDEVDCSKIILAGGLNSDNVRELKGLNFYGVDVSSGVESKKGKKNSCKMNAFIKAVDELV